MNSGTVDIFPLCAFMAGYGMNFALPFNLFCGHNIKLSRQPYFGQFVHGGRTVLTL